MFKTKRNNLLALLLCALLVPMIVIAKDKVERPFKLQGKNSIMLDFSEAFDENGNVINPIVPWWIEWEYGNATHLGQYTSSGTGTYNMVTGETVGSGYGTADNGDKLYWEGTQQAGAPMILIFTGGMGRFEGASGSFTNTSTTEFEGWDPEFPWWRVRSSLSGIGTITY